MAKSVQEMREERTQIAQELHEMVETDAEWTAQNEEDYNKKVAAVEDLDKSIERHEKVAQLNAEKHAKVTARAAKAGISEDEAEHQREQERSVLAAYIRGGMKALTDDEHREAVNRMRNPNNALSTGTDSEGGYLTENEFASTLVEAMKAYGGMREAATVIRTSTGQQMDFPTADATSEEGEIVGENATVADEDPSFGTKNLNTYKYSSKGVAVPFELLQDSQIDIESYVRGLLATRLGRITEKHFTVGTGTGQPNGMITAATVGKVADSATAITYDDLLELEHSVDPVYRMGARFMFNDSVLLQLKKLKDSQGRPLWLPSLVSGDPNTINGIAYTVNQNMASAAANALVAAYGDMRKYVVRDVMQLSLFRFTDSAYTRKGQVGFLAFMRSGGNLIDVGGAVKTLQMAAS